jgi:transposase, IS5 family
MFKVLVLQTLYTLSDDATEYQLKDRLSFMRFCDLALHDPAGRKDDLALPRAADPCRRHRRLFARFDAILRERGYLAMGGQIVDAMVIEARRPRLSREQNGRMHWKVVKRGASRQLLAE